MKILLLTLLIFMLGCGKAKHDARWSDPTPWIHRHVESAPDTHNLKPGYCWCDDTGSSHCMNDQHEIEVTTNTCSSGVVTGAATTNSPNSPAITGNNSTVTYTEPRK